MDGDLLGSPLPAAGGQHQRFGGHRFHAIPVYQGDGKTLNGLLDAGDEGEGPRLQPQGMKFIDETAGVFRAGELFSIPYQAKAIVDALFEDTAQAGFPLDEKNLGVVLVGSNGRGQPGRPSADDQNINGKHAFSLLRHLVLP